MEKQKSIKFIWLILVFGLLLAGATAVFWRTALKEKAAGIFSSPDASFNSPKKDFNENFQKDEVINETAKMSRSQSPDWWVNSGGKMIIEEGVGKTIQGEISPDSEWYKKYKSSNSRDTDGGVHPQNIFRLVTRTKWQNFIQQAHFKINALNFTESENRNESNGILLFNRYEDGDNLYYTGVRVDGLAVIKKKYGGKYYTMSEKEIFPGEPYDREKNPNRLPLGEWIGLKSEFQNTPDGDVEIKLFVRVGKTGNWQLAVSAVDDGRKDFGKNILSDAGYAGIRTDFMDVEFSDYKISETK
ncbi:MAG: hypothetical protein A2359_04305 [Candidatus Moranbacteria bacterium RIFOXYB1_FULL_43_19]|nr:MAG: hypothetical protein A2359_04305 [Candidatus Moranbacteria bacterium RIFOXYB1_FULL_43_19]OGI32876.1 MAG: hypothetical protein A2420_04460 [Candidatus Moranbacteria bacterium RIFOXYC1_FULL_44_13]OGI37356.1 MAG: hypothetical protein A2612_00590 [Candidatus Moranbacteria bacterium RIFOXYD1_FULL_44_12]